MRLTVAMQRRGWHFGNAAAPCGGRMRLEARLAWSGVLLTLLAAAPAVAQAPPAPRLLAEPAPVVRPQPIARPRHARHEKRNRDTLIVAAGGPGTSYLAMTNDLSAALGASGSVRLLPVAAGGGLANLKDVLLLRRIDMAIVPANVLAQAKASKAFEGRLTQRISYIAALYGEEVHVVAGKGIATIGELRGKRVAVPSEDGTARFTASDVFQRLGIAIDSVPMDAVRALAEVRSGAVSAAVLVAGKPLALVSALPKDGSLRLLSLPSAMLPGEGYSPAVLLAEDYPALLAPGGMVETVAVKAVLVTGRGSAATAQRIAEHTPALLEAIATLAASRPRSKWTDVNVGAVLPGWSRAAAAERWLERMSEQRRASPHGRLDGATQRTAPRPRKRVKSAAVSVSQHTRKPAKSTAISASPHKKLFDDFERWSSQAAASQSTAK